MFIINAGVHKEQGKGTSRRLHTTNKFPTIIYGGREASLAVELDHNKVMNMQVEAEFCGKVLTIATDDGEIKVKAQDVQRRPYKPELLHIDFVRA